MTSLLYFHTFLQNGKMTCFFREVFSRRRFMQIDLMLHVGPVTPDGTDSRIMKIGNMVKHVQDRCIKYFIPDKHIAIDETTIPFKGKVSFKIYNSQKLTKWGLRVYALADGYVSVFEPYYGLETTQSLISPSHLLLGL